MKIKVSGKQNKAVTINNLEFDSSDNWVNICVIFLKKHYSILNTWVCDVY